LYMAAPDYLGGIMRDIKYRAWDEEAKKMDYEIICGQYNQGINTELNDFFANGNSREAFSPNYIFMQYTGLHDKNGKEAYHKDLISAYGYSNWIVEWHKNGWYLKQHNIENYKEIPKDFIIMGNIFESNWV
jgi:hypothetical protein